MPRADACSGTVLADRVLIFEPQHGGHHLQFVRVLLEALQDRVRNIDVVLDVNACSSLEFAVQLAKVSRKGITFHEEVQTHGASMYELALRQLIALRKAVSFHKPERVYIPYADGLLQVAGLMPSGLFKRLLRDVPVEVLIMRGGFAYPQASRRHRIRQEFLYHCAARAPFEVVHVLDPLVWMEISRRSDQYKKRARVIPEAVEPLPTLSRSDARRRLGIPLEGEYVVCAGALDSRKGVHLLLQAALDGGLLPSAKLLLVGRVRSDVRPIVEQARAKLDDQLVVIDRYVDEQEFAYAILAADVVAIPYPRHQGSSGLLVRAAAASRYILASDYGWIGWATERFNLGCIVPVSSREAFKAGLEASISEARGYRASASAIRFVAYHTAENQQSHWLQALAASATRPDDIQLRWADVDSLDEGCPPTSGKHIGQEPCG